MSKVSAVVFLGAWHAGEKAASKKRPKNIFFISKITKANEKTNLENFISYATCKSVAFHKLPDKPDNMIKALSFFLLLVSFVSINAQLKSPEQFLGYKPGTHFTPHWKVVNYFQQVAANAASMVKLQQYGETNEGRPLMVAFISTPENIQNLENIRKNNLRLANQ